MFTVVDLSHAPQAVPLISEPLERAMRETLAAGKKVLLYLNRRGAGNAVLCESCGHALPCPRCDVAAKAHERPERKLACHQCGWEGPVPEECPKCGGHGLKVVGTRIQRVEAGLEKLFPGARIARLDSDARRQRKSERPDLEGAQIVLGTQSATAADVPDLGLAAFLDLSAEAMSDDWRALERAYCQAALNAKRGVPVIAQASYPDHPLVQLVTEGNYRDFFKHSMEQRKTFGYPPYRGIAEVAVASERKDRAESVAASLAEKLGAARPADGEIILREAGKSADEWVRRIVLRAKDPYPWLLSAEKELHAYREARVEWK